MSHPLPQSRLQENGRARVIKKVAVVGPNGNFIKWLLPNTPDAIVTLGGKVNHTLGEIRWWVKDPSGGGAHSFEYQNGEYLMEPTGSPPPTGEIKWYTVKEGDTWWGIAQKYNTTVEALKALNQGSGIIRPGDVLHVGDRMRVPA